MKRLLVLIAPIVAGAVLLTACGGAAAPSVPVKASTSTQPAATPKPTATTAPSAPATIPSGPLLIVWPDAYSDANDYGVVEPTVIGVGANMQLQLRNIQWRSWGPEQAFGTGDAVSAGASITLVPVTVTLSAVVNGRYTSMVWTNGGSINNQYDNGDLIVLVTKGGKQVPTPNSAASGSSPSASASGPHNYNNLNQLEQAVKNQIEGSTSLKVSSTICVLWPTAARKFTCTVDLGAAGSDRETVVVKPDGSDFTVVASG